MSKQKLLYEAVTPKSVEEYNRRLSNRLKCLALAKEALEAYYAKFPTVSERFANDPKDVWALLADARCFTSFDYELLTPWGKAQWVQCEWVELDGSHITIVETSSHGGWRVTGSLLKQMPEALRKIGNSRGWFEEDCAWAAIPVGLPHLFDPKSVEKAKQTLQRWYPEVLTQLAQPSNHSKKESEPDMTHVHEYLAKRHAKLLKLASTPDATIVAELCTGYHDGGPAQAFNTLAEAQHWAVGWLEHFLKADETVGANIKVDSSQAKLVVRRPDHTGDEFVRFLEPKIVVACAEAHKADYPRYWGRV